MTTASILESIQLVTISRNPSISYSRRKPLPPSLSLLLRVKLLGIRDVQRLRVQCLKCEGVSSMKREDTLVEGAIKLVRKAVNGFQKPAMVLLVVGLLLSYNPSSSLAASGGRMGGRSFSSPGRSFSYSSRSNTVLNTGFSYSVPYMAPSPFGFGGGIYVSPAVGFGAGSGTFLLLLGFAAFVLVSGFLSDRSEDSVITATQKTSILMLQVGLLGMARSFQKDIDRIAEAADTSSSEGLNYVLTESALALLRHPDCCVSGYSSVRNL
ncbi:unnamed protein product [Victoria cruziana]